MRLLIIILFVSNSIFSVSQPVQRVVTPGNGLMSTIGIVQVPNSDSTSIAVMHALDFLSDGGINTNFQLSILDVSDELNVSKIIDLSDDLLGPNEKFLQQIIKDDIWYVLGYEVINSLSLRYFIKQLTLESGEVEFTTDVTIYSDKLDTIKSVPFVYKARVLDDNRISFCGMKKTSDRDEERSLFLIFDTENQSLFEVETPFDINGGQERFFYDAFIINDTLFAHYALNDKIPIIVYDSDYKIKERRPIASSLIDSNSQVFNYGYGINVTFWGNEIVFSGGNQAAAKPPFKEDVYFQLYNDNFELTFDESFQIEGRESTPDDNSFVPFDDEYAVFISYTGPTTFTFNFPHNLYLRFYERTSRKSTLLALEDENFTHFDEPITIGNKLLLSGYTTVDNDNKVPNIYYYLIDYNGVILSVDGGNEDFSQTFKIFPNPVKSGGKLNLNWHAMASQAWSLKLYDKQGRLVHTASIAQGFSEYSIMLPELPSGNYIIRAEGDSKQVHTGTLVVE
jgi:hypothetical protein